jgi:hypothetical protein
MPAAESNAEIRDRLLPAVTVRISVGGDRTGSGFFVGHGTIVTCKHVLKPLDLSDADAVAMIGVTGLVESETHPVLEILHASADDREDLAVLRVESPSQRQCALLDRALNPGDVAHAFGFTALHNEGIPLTLENEGLTGDRKLLKLKAGRVEHGMSGSPVLNVRTGAVCGVLKRTVGADQALGGYAVPIASLLELSDPIARRNHDFHVANREWLDMLPDPFREAWLAGRGRDGRGGGAELAITLSVMPEVDRWEVTAYISPSGRTIGPERVDFNSVRLEVVRLFRGWAARGDSMRSGRVDPSEQLRSLGTILATAVLPGEIKTMIEQLLSNRPAGWVEVALRFERATDPDLEYLPWEHLYIAASGDRGESYLAREKGFAFTRARDEAPWAGDAPTAQELSVLLVSAHPSGPNDAEVALRHSVMSVSQKTSDLLHRLDRVTATHVTPATPAELSDTLQRLRPAVIHYVGYGRFANGRDEIAIGELHGWSTYVDAESFALLLVDAAPRVAILQLCGARPSSEEYAAADLSPYASEVLRHADALVAYQYPAFSEFAECFNDCFYRRVAAGGPVELAAQEGRTELWIKDPTSREFLAPTIAVRRPGGLRLIS